MAQRTIMTLMCLVPLFFGGCGNQKISAEVLIVKIQAHGHQVSRGERIHHTVRGATEAFWITVDGGRASAWLFDRESAASLCASTMAGGFCVGYWAFEYADSVTARKIKEALQDKP